MTLMQENFKIAAELNENAAVRIQTVIRLLWDNTETRIKLKNPVEGGNLVDFEIMSGTMADVDMACSPNGVTCNENTLQV